MKGVVVKDKKWRKMLDVATKLGGRVVKVGVIGAEAEAESAEGISMGRLAGVHEFGAAIQMQWGVLLIPERSFIRASVAENDRAYSDLVERYATAVLEGRMSEDRALGRLGARAAADMQRKISKGVDPANAPSTITAKGSSKPLVDTGRLRQSITFLVVDKEATK